MRLLGFPLMRYIDVQNSEEVLRAIHMTSPDVPLDIVLHTPGGLVLAAIQIARAIRDHKAKVTVFVPHYAMSGGTLIALAANRDCHVQTLRPRWGRSTARTISSSIADQSHRAEACGRDRRQHSHHGRRGAEGDRPGQSGRARVSGARLSPEQAETLAETLSTGQWTHDYPISAAEATQLGLPVNTDMPDEVMELMSLYPQPVRHSGSVEYLPVPRQKGAGRSPPARSDAD